MCFVFVPTVIFTAFLTRSANISNPLTERPIGITFPVRFCVDVERHRRAIPSNAVRSSSFVLYLTASFGRPSSAIGRAPSTALTTKRKAATTTTIVRRNVVNAFGTNRIREPPKIYKFEWTPPPPPPPTTTTQEKKKKKKSPFPPPGGAFLPSFASSLAAKQAFASCRPSLSLSLSLSNVVSTSSQKEKKASFDTLNFTHLFFFLFVLFERGKKNSGVYDQKKQQ